MIAKPALRTQQIARLQAARAQTQAVAAILCAQLTVLPAWREAKTVATTVAGEFELPTVGIIEAAQAAGKIVLLPRVMSKRQLAFLPDPGEAQRIVSAYGLAEPPYDATAVVANPDLIIVPGLAFALDSHARVGFGGGYYDRFLAHATGHTIALVPPAMAFATADWPIEATDIRIQTLLTA